MRAFRLRQRVALLALLTGLLAVLAPTLPAQAHPIGASAVSLTVHSRSVTVEVVVPTDKLAAATGLRIDSAASVTANESALRDAVSAAVQLADASGTPYQLRLDSIGAQEVNGTTAMVADLTATPPGAEVSGDVVLDYSLVIDRLPGHRAFVFLVSDVRAGKVAEGGPISLGVLDGDHRSLTIARAGASEWTALGAMVGMGARHIQDGTDHLLFLVTLLLAAPLLASGGRWGQRRTVERALVRTLGIVSAFTAGHTVSLALVSFGLVSFPSRPVELLVAGSILVAAVHALRPLTSRGEIIVGGAFGLVHGTAFATAILDLGLDTRATVVAVLGFNVGVELAQLVVVALVLPVLMLMATRGWYQWVRRLAASFSAIASVCWMVAILTGTTTVLQPLFDLLGSEPLISYAVFASAAVGAWAATAQVRPRASRAIRRDQPVMAASRMTGQPAGADDEQQATVSTVGGGRERWPDAR